MTLGFSIRSAGRMEIGDERRYAFWTWQSVFKNVFILFDRTVIQFKSNWAPKPVSNDEKRMTGERDPTESSDDKEGTQ
jgi:hypothetical protein